MKMKPCFSLSKGEAVFSIQNDFNPLAPGFRKKVIHKYGFLEDPRVKRILRKILQLK